MIGRWAVWLDREAGQRALVCAKTKFQRDVVLGEEPWDGVASIGRDINADAYGRNPGRGGARKASSEALFLAMRQRGVARTTFANGATTRGLMLPAPFASRTLVIGEVSPGFEDDTMFTGTALAAALVLASCGRERVASDDLRDVFARVRDVEELFALIDGKPRERDEECGLCRGTGVDVSQGGVARFPCHSCSGIGRVPRGPKRACRHERRGWRGSVTGEWAEPPNALARDGTPRMIQPDRPHDLVCFDCGATLDVDDGPLKAHSTGH